MSKKIAVIILAAGKSTRMKSDTPKVLHPICGRPMLGYVMDIVKSLKAQKTIAVLGYKYQQVKKDLPAAVKVVLQKRLLGTADAVKSALAALGNFSGTILVLYGDTPLLKISTVKDLLKRHCDNHADATLLTARLDQPAGYGRILRDEYGSVSGIVEESDADDFQKDIKEINTGIICFNSKVLARALKKVKANRKNKEYYLTDTVSVIYKNSGAVYNLNAANSQEAIGINSRLDLARANHLMQRRINEEIMQGGVTVVDTDTTFIDYGAQIGPDTTIYPFTAIERDVKIGKCCRVGPFAHLRAGSRLADKVTIGNFTELVRTHIGAGTLMKHFSYLGDSRVGKNVNIGAGTVTANFDGKNKHTSIIKDGALVGSDTVLIAPVEIGRGAKTGAGAVVTKNTRISDYSVVAGVPARTIKKSGKRR